MSNRSRVSLPATILIVLIAALAAGFGLRPLLAQDMEDGITAFLVDDYRAALQVFEPAAQGGDALAQAYLGSMYFFGLGLSQDYSQSIYWYELAAAQNNARAENALGVMYTGGLGVERNAEVAFYWFRRAAEQGHESGMINLGGMYLRGDGVIQDREVGQGWIRKSIQAAMAREKLERVEIPTATVESEQEINLPEESGQQDTGPGELIIVPENLITRRENGNQNPRPVARPQYTESNTETEASEPFTTAQGWSFETGVQADLAGDLEKAFEIRRALAELGEARSQTNLGAMYLTGRGVGKDEEAAAHWFRKAALQGYASGQQSLGTVYMFGAGVEQNDILAAMWFRIADAKGDNLARSHCGT